MDRNNSWRRGSPCISHRLEIDPASVTCRILSLAYDHWACDQEHSLADVKALDAGMKLLLFLKSPIAAVAQPSITTTAGTSLNVLDTKSAKAQSSHNSSTLAQNGSISSTLEWTLGTSGAGTKLVWVAHDPIQVTEVAQPSIATTVDTSLNVFATTSAKAQSLYTLAHNRSEVGLRSEGLTRRL